jgi:hypothetical protein
MLDNEVPDKRPMQKRTPQLRERRIRKQNKLVVNEYFF